MIVLFFCALCVLCIAMSCVALWHRQKWHFEWGRETRLALDKMKLREILVSKELDLSKFE